MPYDPAAIANYFLDLAEASDQCLDPMKVQKLVYFAHGWHLALRGDLLVNEQVEAWSHGPVIRSLWNALRHFKGEPIVGKVKRSRMIARERSREFVLYEPSVDDDSVKAVSTKAFLGRIWDVYGAYTGIQLSNLTHEAGTPWTQIWEEYKGKPPRGTDIPRESIERYFRTLAGA